MVAEAEVLQAFGLEHAVRLTGLTAGQLRAWDRTRLFQPEFSEEDRRLAYSRVYSFRDIVALRTIAVLQKQYGVSTQHLRHVAEKLMRRGFSHWAEVRLYVLNRQVHFRKPNSDEVEGALDGQLAMLPIIDVIDDVRLKVRDLTQRSSRQVGKIEQHKHVVRNASVLAGTRIPTAAIRRFREAGYTTQQILEEYPSLSKKDVQAALAFEREKERVA